MPNERRLLRVYPILAALIVAATASLSLSGCGPLVVVGAGYTGAVLHDRRPSEQVLKDENIELQAQAAIDKHAPIGERSAVTPTAYNGVVLLTGQARTEGLRSRFAQQTAALADVTRVINEIEVGENASIAEDSTDTLLATRCKTALISIGIEDFDITRVKVITERGVVYLMGLVTHAEGDAVGEKLRFVPGVKRVVKVFEYI